MEEQRIMEPRTAAAERHPALRELFLGEIDPETVLAWRSLETIELPTGAPSTAENPNWESEALHAAAGAITDLLARPHMQRLRERGFESTLYENQGARTPEVGEAHEVGEQPVATGQLDIVPVKVFRRQEVKPAPQETKSTPKTGRLRQLLGKFALFGKTDTAAPPTRAPYRPKTPLAERLRPELLPVELPFQRVPSDPKRVDLHTSYKVISPANKLA